MTNFFWMISLGLCVGISAAMASETTPDASRMGESVNDGYRFQDFLGREWRNELVQFPLSESLHTHTKAGHALVDPDGKPVPYQVIQDTETQQPKIAFLVNLDPFETNYYRFTEAPASKETDLNIEETPDFIRVFNNLTGISIRRKFASETGPIEAIRTTSGQWIGQSRLSTERKITEYTAQIVARGPVFSEVVCRVSFEGGRQWELRFRLCAHEPVIVVDEMFSLQDDSSFVLSFSRNFSPDTIMYRFGKGRVGQNDTWRVNTEDPEPAFVLEPWLRWWEHQRQGNWLALYNENSPDLLAIGALNPSVWVDPARSSSRQQSPPRILFTLSGEDITAAFPLQGGHRRWMIAALEKSASLMDTQKENTSQATLPQKYLIKHGDFPLDMVKDYMFQWDGDHDNYPRLFLTEERLSEFRRTFQIDPDKLAQYTKNPIYQHQMDGPIQYYLATADAQLGQHIAETAVEWVQSAVNMYLHQDALATLGFAPHHQTEVLTSINLSDTILASDHLPKELRERLRAQVAFLGYTVNRADYWSPERGFSANPNMTTTVAAYQVATGCLIPSHPEAASWVKNGLSELKDNQLDHWSDDNGGWLEAPHYAMVSYDYLVGCFMMAGNAGLGEYLYDLRMKKVIEWFAKISTPPDSRIKGWRHYPPIGNTYICEPTGEFGIIAGIWKDRDPEFAARMQWMHLQQGAQSEPGIGGFFPTLAGYRGILRNDSIPARAPQYQSELFPKTGVILRNKYPDERETCLHIIAGPNHDHYDKDSGSITLWGKGRILADDFGYYGYVTGEDHSMVMGPEAVDSTIMNVTEFTTSDDLDYVRGVKQAWTRQIIFVKDADPLGPNYFVISDSLNATSEATWRLWMTGEKVDLAPQRASLTGNEDVDMDIFFLLPDRADLQTDTISRTSSCGLTPDARWSAITTTQTGVILKTEGESEIVAVLYPRLKTQEPPVVQSIADGRGIKLRTADVTDYVFLNDEAFSFREGDISFEGTAGAIRVTGNRCMLSLGAAGRISAKSKTLEADESASKWWTLP